MIGIDARAAAEVPAGRGRYTRELLRHLSALETDHRFALYARQKWDRLELGERFEWRLIGSSDPLWHLKAARAASSECDVLLSTNSYLTAWFTSIPTVPVVYDMVAFDKQLLPQRRAAMIERATLSVGARRSAALLAISESTRRDLIERLPRVAAKTRVVPLAADERFTAQPGPGDQRTLARHGLGDRYLLSVGTLEPRKNLPRLAQAVAAIDDEITLAIVGPPGWELDEVMAGMAGSSRPPKLLGHVPDEDLPALYRGATLFCYPSLYEGFGFPILEAMSCGAPVLTSNRSSMPEVGGSAAAYVDPTDTARMSQQISALLADRQRLLQMSQAGIEQAAGFSWQRTASETLAVLEACAGN